MTPRSLRSILPSMAGDGLVGSLMFFWFFITTCTYVMIRPVRSSLVLYSYGPRALPWVYMGTALATGVAVYLLAKLARYPRRLLIGGTLIFFALNLAGWWWIATQAEAARHSGLHSWRWTTPVFFVWTDVFSIVVVTVFWMYAADIFRTEHAKRLFGAISAAGPAGGVLGASLTEMLVRIVGTSNMLLVAACIYVVALFLFIALERLTRGRSAQARAFVKPPEIDASRLVEVLRWVRSSKLLLFLTLLVGFERVVPDFSDFLFQSVGSASFQHAEDYAHFFAGFEKWTNLGALIVSLALTSPLLHLVGVRPLLLLLPLSTFVLTGGFLALPTLGLVAALKAADAGQRHSLFKASKEVVYTATDREVIYRVKGYIEMFVYRFARGLAGLVILVITLVGGGLSTVAIISLPVALAWVYCAWQVGSEYHALERASSAATENTPASASAAADQPSLDKPN